MSKSGVVKKVCTIISKTSCPNQLAIGVVSGWLTGHFTMKLGRPTAFTVGGGIIAFQIVQITGLVKMDWNAVREKAVETSKKFGGDKYMNPKLISNVKAYGRSNTCFAAGFIGGFLIGLAI